MRMKMLGLENDWFSDPFSPFRNMESEIAELKTMTRVTKLRQMIECKEEGAWMVVRDIPDNTSKTGTRKVTSYGRASRSVTRSVSSNVDLNLPNENNVIIEFPEEKTKPIEITEVIKPEPNVPEKTSPKKTSVVTLGKGNLVLIDAESDSNFHVTGISKGKVADAISTLERNYDKKKPKKVGFSKTEVHFAPDSGKVNIVETDEKPPPVQVIRRKKRQKSFKNDLPKLYFGGNQSSPDVTKPIEIIKESKDTSINYLGNVSPKLSKLLQNSMEHEFQIKQKHIMSKKQELPTPTYIQEPELNELKSVKVVTQVNLNQDKEEKLEPLYVNGDITEIKRPVVVLEKDKAPKPKPRTSITKINVKEEKKCIKPAEKLIKPREIKKETTQVKTVKNEPCRRNKIKTEISSSTRLQKLIKNTGEVEKTKKPREPLRSFEKISNGWVGHVVPLKPQKPTTTRTISLQSQGKKNEVKICRQKNSLLANKQYSLSKEHLRSAKLVKELDKEEKKIIEKPKKIALVRPHTIDKVKTTKTIVRKKYERSRLDSDQSDDSVVRADEEVRAYMLNTRHK